MARQSVAKRFEKWRLRAVVAWAIVGAIVLFLLAVRGLAVVGQAVELLLIGGIVGFICSPIVNQLEDRGIPRGIAALVALLVVVACIVLVVALFVGPFTHELTELLKSVPSYVTQIQGALETFWDTFGSSSSANMQNTVNTFVQALAEAGAGVKLVRHGVKERFGQVGAPSWLQKEFHLTADDLVSSVKGGLA